MAGPHDPTLAAPPSDAPASSVDAMLGVTIDGRYRLLELIGHGGMGSVYLARHVGVGKLLAVKLLDARYAREPGAAARLFREARAAAAIGHPSIVDVSDVGVASNGSPYLVMELLDGEDLASLLSREAPISVAAACGVLEPLLGALAAAHDKGIVHRDLKPGNIFVCRGKDADPTVKLIDFGVAKQTATSDQAPITVGGTVLGTPSYMAPEQARGRGDIDARADLYAVGVVFYQMVTGELPYEGANYNETLFNIVHGDAIPPDSFVSDLPEDAVLLIRRALAKDPAERYQSAARMKQAFTNLWAWGERHKELAELYVQLRPHRPSDPDLRKATPSTVVSPVMDGGDRRASLEPAAVSPYTPAPPVDPRGIDPTALGRGSETRASGSPVPANDVRTPVQSGPLTSIREPRSEARPAEVSQATDSSVATPPEGSAKKTASVPAATPPPAPVQPAPTLPTSDTTPLWYRAGLLLGMLVATAALVGLVREFLPTEPPAQPDTTKTSEPGKVPPRFVTLTLSGAPPGAQVSYAGTPVADNPLRVRTQSALVPLRVEHEDYEPFETQLVPARDMTIAVVMRPLAASAQPPPVPPPSTEAQKIQKAPTPRPSTKPEAIRRGARDSLYTEEFE